VNHKKVERIYYRDEGLSLRRRRRKKLAAVPWVALLRPTQPGRCYALDFVHDRLVKDMGSLVAHSLLNVKIIATTAAKIRYGLKKNKRGKHINLLNHMGRHHKTGNHGNFYV